MLSAPWEAAVAVRSSRTDVAAVLLVALFVRHYAYDLWPPEQRGLAAKAMGALALVTLVWLAVLHVQRSLAIYAVALWFSVEEVQVTLCSFLYMRKPWPVQPGQSICSARLDLDLGALGIVVVFWLSLLVLRSLYGNSPPSRS